MNTEQAHILRPVRYIIIKYNLEENVKTFVQDFKISAKFAD